MALGLLVDGKFDMVKSIVAHCIFEIKHYNKVLNGNRSYVSLPCLRDLRLILVPRSIPAPLLDGLGSPVLQPARSTPAGGPQTMAQGSYSSRYQRVPHVLDGPACS